MSDSGILFLIKKNDVVIGGIRSKSVSFSSESIDATTGDHAAKRVLLAAAAQEQIDISGEGLEGDDLAIRNVAFGSVSKMLTDITIEWPLQAGESTPASLACNFRLSSYEITAGYKEGATFSFAMESSGAWTFTEGAA